LLAKRSGRGQHGPDCQKNGGGLVANDGSKHRMHPGKINERRSRTDNTLLCRFITDLDTDVKRWYTPPT
jgi:hypothetical protein